MKKQKINIKDLKRDHIRKHLKIVHPFLRREFRELKATELNSKKVFTEFFGKVPYELWKLKAIYEYQL